MHKQNVVHRDLKPGNFFLTKNKIVKIGDFGVSKRASVSKDLKLSTIIGTPLYMAPEILMGKKYTASVDIWALGVCIFELLTLKRPF